MLGRPLRRFDCLDSRRSKQPTTSLPLFSGFEKSCGEQLVREGHTTLDLDLALVAIRFYARRKFICYGRIFVLYASENFAGLANYIETDDKALGEILPDEEKSQEDKYRRLLNFYRNLHIRIDDEGKWVRQAPLSTAEGLVNPSLRPWRSELRANIEMGLCRSVGSSGPPPANLSISPASFRRQSDPLRGGTKRSAEEQPSGSLPVVKAARGLNYPHVRPETKGAIKDSDAIGVAKPVADLHALHSELAYRCPEKTKMYYKEKIARLEKELESVGTAIRKKAKDKVGKGKLRG